MARFSGSRSSRRPTALAVVATAALSMWVADAHANYWTGDFTITNLYVAGENNFQYRTYGAGSQPICPNSPNWAYVNDADSGSKGKIATILAAFYTGRPIRVYIEAVNGFCHIEEVFASP